MKRSMAWGVVALALAVGGCDNGGGGGNQFITGPLPITGSATSNGQTLQVTATPAGFTPATMFAIGIDTDTGQNNNVQLHQSQGIWTGTIPNVLSSPGDHFRVDVTAYPSGSTTPDGFGSFSGSGGGTGGSFTGFTGGGGPGGPPPPPFSGGGSQGGTTGPPPPPFSH